MTRDDMIGRAILDAIGPLYEGSVAARVSVLPFHFTVASGRGIRSPGLIGLVERVDVSEERDVLLPSGEKVHVAIGYSDTSNLVLWTPAAGVACGE